MARVRVTSVVAEATTLVTGGSGASVGASASFNAIGWDITAPLNSALAVLSTLDALIGTGLAATEEPGGSEARASIENSHITASRDVTLDAESAAQINATVTNVSRSTGEAVFGAEGLGAGGIVANNRISSAARAFVKDIDASKKLTATGTLTVRATDSAGLYANSKLITSQVKPSRSRPACAYPSQTVWDGEGDPDRADSFSCVENDDDIAGDVDGDGEVNFADFLILSANFGNTEAARADGDLDGDGQVAFADFLILSNNFAAAEPQAIVASSAEDPPSAELATAGALGERKGAVHRSHQLDEFVLANFDEVLTGCDADLFSGSVPGARLDSLAKCAFFHSGDEVPGDAKIHVRFEKRTANITQRLINVFLGQLANAAELVARRGKSLSQCFKHKVSRRQRRIADAARFQVSACPRADLRALWVNQGSRVRLPPWVATARIQ